MPSLQAKAFRPRRDAEYSYILDCAVELGEITPFEAGVFFANTPAAIALDKALERQTNWPKHFLRNTARDYLNQLPSKERLVWALRSFEGMGYALKSLSERIEYVIQQKVQSDLGLDERVSIAWMDELKDVEDFAPKVFHSVHDITPDKVQEFINPLYAQTREVLLQDLDLLSEAVQWLKQPGARAEAQQIALKLFEAVGTDPVALPTVKQLSKFVAVKKKRNQARGAIKKALSLFTNFGMEKQVQMLVSGSAVTLSHPDSVFKLEVAPLQQDWLESRTVEPGGHVPFRLSLLTKDDIFLARLCVLFDSTPVLDQLFALSLFVQTGQEQELLLKANWFGIEDLSQVRTILENKAPALLAKVPTDCEERGRGLVFDPRLTKLNKMQANWAPYKAPVGQWLNSWFGPVASGIAQLQTQTAPQLA